MTHALHLAHCIEGALKIPRSKSEQSQETGVTVDGVTLLGGVKVQDGDKLPYEVKLTYGVKLPN